MYCVLVDALDKMEKVTNFDLTVTDFDIAFDMLEVIKVASEPASRSTLTSNIFEPLLISTGITWRNLILSIFWFCWLKVLLMLGSCCVSSWCSTVWCFLPQILALHFHLHIHSFMTCVLHSLYFVEKSILSFTDIFLKIGNSPSNGACPHKANTLVFLCYLQVLMALIFCLYCFTGILGN